MRDRYDIDSSNARLAGAFLGVMIGLVLVSFVVWHVAPKVIARVVYVLADDGRAPHPSERR